MRWTLLVTALAGLVLLALLPGSGAAETRAEDANGRTAADRPQGEQAPEADAPASRGARRVLRVLDGIRKRLKRTRYQHRTVVRHYRGVYLWDCSGMAEWVLRRVAPRTLRGIYRERPVARDFYRVISRAPTDRGRRGWRRIARLQDARPGDVFAWLRPPHWGKGVTGHVGFLVRSPRPLKGHPYVYTLRIADATSLPHQDDTREYGGAGGFGHGTIIFGTDGNGAPTHYGWHGTRAGMTAETRIVLGRIE